MPNALSAQLSSVQFILIRIRRWKSQLLSIWQTFAAWETLKRILWCKKKMDWKSFLVCRVVRYNFMIASIYFQWHFIKIASFVFASTYMYPKRTYYNVCIRHICVLWTNCVYAFKAMSFFSSSNTNSLMLDFRQRQFLFWRLMRF